LVRGSYGPDQAAIEAKENEDKAEAESAEGKDAEGATPAEGQESIDDLEGAVRKQEEDAEAEKKGKDNKLPQETIPDLRPFPMNKFFRSQPVLSEELREAIYQSVVKEGKTVPLASIHYGVSNERVGAVVRLKQMEKQWIAQVCSHPPPVPIPTPFMMNIKNSISL
jgi:hypothetical protein